MIDNGLTALLLCGLVWFWWESRGAAEIAIQAAMNSCNRANVTLLNDTVARKKLRLKRNSRGRVQFQRTYFFEFASDMQQRYQGEVIMLGHSVTNIDMDAYRITQ